MIVPSSGVKVLIAMKPVDFRKGMDGLAAVVHETLGANPFGGVIYVFRSKRADRVKLLFWDGTGLVLATKRLEQGSFRPPSSQGDCRITRSLPRKPLIVWTNTNHLSGLTDFLALPLRIIPEFIDPGQH